MRKIVTSTALQAAIDSQSVPVGQVIRLLDDVHTEAGIVVDKDVILEGLGVEKTSSTGA